MKNDLVLVLLGALLAILASGLALPVSVQNATEEMDPELIGGFVEGDMIIDPTRNVVIFKVWPTCHIPYYFNCTEYSETQVQAIKDAFAIITNTTGLCFNQIYEPLSGQGYININCEPNGCNAGVGYITGPCRMNLQLHTPGTGCFLQGRILHEILHVLGFWHQHTSFNRDEHVIIHEENIMDDKKSAFRKQSWYEGINWCDKYDLRSVMHYGRLVFSKNGYPTIEPLMAGVVIGQRVGMSQIDICRLRVMYGHCLLIHGRHEHNYWSSVF